ncbi:alpha/beta-hydrolase [Fistulina hepatica ATCC 64428]|uniref:Carboxylic ester hydrolase n=1 Tax=Fistulina hepatica ATCC 64428 TaxID=1128425 RepID=A0A0D6ZYQ5_9AGAR|nr:alpha/beta-hydrolase [Fistulina hepatica ATCC 64428]
MVAFTAAVVSVLCFLTVIADASPLKFTSPNRQPQSSGSHQHLVFPVLSSTDIWCKIPLLSKFLCPRTNASSTVATDTKIGTAKGYLYSTSGVTRYPVKYASASRWQASSTMSVWDLPYVLNDSDNATALPLACPQTDLNSTDYAEDCLSMLIYVPPSVTSSSSVPVLVWIHGGSFVIGSATQAGLDGSDLAVATDSIVVVLQYRLGALGFMAPDGSTNLAVKDVINALEFLDNTISSFGGDSSMITLAGQSSGAGMIRALLATPSASSYFKSAILQSDPMNFGFLNTSTQESMQSYYNDLVGCSSSDTSCFDALSVSDILTAETTLYDNAESIDASAGSAEPIRPVHDGTLITSALDLTVASDFPAQTKTILLSNVKNEAGPTIYGDFTSVLPSSYFDIITEEMLGDPRATTVENSSYYTTTAIPASADDARVSLEVLGTDYMWRCATWSFAGLWASNGGTAYVGLYTVGATYPDNEDIPFCADDGGICHEDDIEIVFGTVSDPTTAQSDLITQVQARYKAFLYDGTPNSGSYTTWTAATSTDINPLNLGGTDTIETGACNISFWGDAVEYDYQVYYI